MKLRHLLLLAYSLQPTACILAQVAQIRWDVQVDRPVPHDLSVWQGETVDLLPRLVLGTQPVAVTNAPVEFRYREDALATNLYRSVSAAANTNSGVLAVRWLPDYDVGAPAYDYQIIVGSNAANPRCFGRITMRPTLGWPASTNAPAPVALTNAQWLSADAWQRGSNALAAAAQAAQQKADAALPSSSSNRFATAAQGAKADTALQSVPPLSYTIITDAPWLLTSITNGWEVGSHAGLVTAQQLADALAAIPAPAAPTRLIASDSNSWVRVDGGTSTTWQVSSASGTPYYTVEEWGLVMPAPIYVYSNTVDGVDYYAATNNSGDYVYCVRAANSWGVFMRPYTSGSAAPDADTVEIWDELQENMAVLTRGVTPGQIQTNRAGTVVSVSMILLNSAPTNLLSRLYFTNNLLVVERYTE